MCLPRLAKQPRAAECSAPELACSETAMLPSLQARFNIAAGIIRSAMIAADVPPAFARLPRECADDRGGESAMTASFDGQQILPLLAIELTNGICRFSLLIDDSFC